MIRKELIVFMLIFILLFQFLTPLLNACYAVETDIIDNNEEGVSEDISESDTLDLENEVVDEEENVNIENEEISTEDIITNDINIEETSENEAIEENIEQNEIEEISEEIIDDKEELDSIIDEDIEELEIIENADIGIMLASGDYYIGNENEFRNALASHADNIRVRQSIDFTSPVYINYPVRIVDESDDNALRYGANGQSFIIVQNGGSLTLDGMVVDTNSSGATGMTAINIEAGGSVTFVRSSIVDGGLGNTGILVNSGASLLMWSSHIVRCGIGINVQGNGNLSFATEEGRQNKFYWNTKAVLFDNFNGTCNLNQENILMYDNSNCGVYLGNVSGTVNVSAGTYYNNPYAIHNCSGTTNVSGGNFYSNGWALRVGGNLNLTGGSIHDNDIGVLTDEANNGKFVMTGGSIYNNTTHAIQHQKINDGGCTILGGSISGDVYLQKNDNYVNTNSSYPTFTVTPSTYFFKRKLVRTTDNNTAKSEINKVTLTPKDAWYKYVSNEYIVLWKNNNIIVRCMDKDVANKTLKINENIYNGPLYLQGAKFNILDSNGNIVDTLTTDQNGYAISKALPAETTYKVKQISTLANYNIDSKEETINFTDATYTTNFINEHKKGNLSVTKTDADDDNLKIKGVTFNVYANQVDSPYKKGDLVGTYTTDDSGKINANLWTGSYYLTETNTQNIYNLATGNYDVNISENNTTEKNITNEKKKCSIAINKIDIDRNEAKLSNVTFDILDDTDNVIDTITTDENGYAKSKKLPIDKKYYLKETKTQENYYLNENIYEIDFIKELGYVNDKIYTIDITNEHKKGNILISKVDFDNNEEPVSDVTFELHVRSLDNPYKENDLIGIYTTDKDGKIYVEDLWTGEYYLTETKTQDRYRLNNEKINITVDDGETYNQTITNEKKKDKIEITVKDEDTDIPLDNISFEILDEDGNVVDTITTDEDGHAISKDLPIDEKYIVIQKDKKDNYISNDEKIEVDFIKEFGYEDEQIFPINITNKHKEGDILLKKVDFDNNDITLEGFKFELYVENVDKPYEKDQLINTYVTNENGEIYIEKIWTGDYYFKEVNTETSKYYRLIEDKIEVTVEENNISEFTVTNEKQKGNIEINKKVSSTDSSITEKKSGTPLADAIFGIYDKDGNEVAQITTDENGYAISEGLPIDNIYTIKEIKAPEWYLKDDNLEENVEFKEDREIVSFEWKDEAVCAELEIEESGIIETQANDLIKYDITKLENRSNVEIDNFTFEDNIPYEYVTLKSLYTGTYNYNKDYTVWYKIKDQENWIQMLNDNTEDGTYNTKKNNYIDFSGINGTITDFKIEFGTAPKDFSIIANDKPFLFAKVNQDVKNKDKWNNVVKLYGTYTSNHNNTINIEDSSEAETICYAKKLEVDSNNKNKNTSRKILPKTGF